MPRVEPFADREPGPARRGYKRVREAQLRIRSLYEAARKTRGAVDLMLQHLQIDIGNFRQRISLMKAQGWARTVGLYDPARCGEPVRVVCLVALRRERPDAGVVFERYCGSEPAITNAVFVSGRYDYQLTSHHPSTELALAWAEELRRRPEIALVDQRFAEVVFGHELKGLPLMSGPGRRAARKSRPASKRGDSGGVTVA